MDNAEYITGLFRTSFSSISQKKIFIYGLSGSTGSIIENCKEFNICGLLDGIKTSGILYGKRIFDINELPSLGADAVIIVARKGTTAVINRRINGFCRDNRIDLFDIYGNDLLKADDELLTDNEYYSLSYDSLINDIDRHDVISFDIFDTLLMRKVLFPRDVFEIAAEKNKDIPFDFVSERVSAEQELMLGGYPSLDDIYDRISRNNNGADVSHLYTSELEIERQVIIARKRMRDAFDYAVGSGRDVYLVSDMYLDKKTLNTILEQNNICGYKDLIVSCEYGVSKSNGLFGVLKDITGGKSCLHIGDSEEADGFYPRLEGIDSFLIKSAYEMTEISMYRGILDYSSYNSRLKAGLFISEIFNDPFSLFGSGGKPCINTASKLGYCIAPVISDFVLWLSDKTAEDNCSELLLASRDGFLIKKMLDAANFCSVNYCYFLTSRSSAAAAGIYNEDDIGALASLPYTDNPESMMKNRYMLDDNEISEYDDRSGIDNYIMAHKDVILKKAARNRENYKKYISRAEIDLDKKIGFFDFVSSGTTQLWLEKTTETKLYGYYFIHITEDDPKKKELAVRAMLEKGPAYRLRSNVYEKYVLLESIITSDKPTLKGFSDEGSPLYFEEYRERTEIEKVMDIQSFVISFFKDYLELYDKQERDPSDISDMILGFADSKKSIMDPGLVSRTIWKDEFNGTVFEPGTMT